MNATQIEFRYNHPLDPQAVAELFRAAGMPRPVDDLPRITRMLAGANLTLSAWDGPLLVAVCRALTDQAYCCYISELAVHPHYQKQGVGDSLIAKLRQTLGEEVSLILLSVPGAMNYYPRLGFKLADNAFVLSRLR
jgi:GNAT superfamily N-acetyltransferase